MIGGPHIHLDKYLGVAWADRPPTPSGPPADPERTAREASVTRILPGRLGLEVVVSLGDLLP